MSKFVQSRIEGKITLHRRYIYTSSFSSAFSVIETMSWLTNIGKKNNEKSTTIFRMKNTMHGFIDLIYFENADTLAVDCRNWLYEKYTM